MATQAKQHNWVNRARERVRLLKQLYLGVESKVIKEFTFITPPEYETQVLGELGKSGVVQLKEVTGADFERLKKVDDKAIDYKGLYEKYHEVYQVLVDAGLLEYPSVDASTTELKEFFEDPEGEVESLLNELNEFKNRLTDREERLLEIRTRLERVRALQPEEFKRCLAVGMVELQLIPRLVEHLKRFGDMSHKVIEISEDTGYIFVFGPEDRREWVETLFVVFDVKDIFEVLSTGDILLALDAEMREKVIREYEEEAEKLQLLVERDEEEEAIKDQIEKIQDLVKTEGKEQFGTLWGKARFYDYILWIMASETIPVMRTKVFSVIQGWITGDKLPVLEEIREGLEEKTGKLFFVQIEEPSHDDHVIPTPSPEIKPSFLQPAWTLTTLRGWPSAHEVNPALISILVFSFQFGIMFGDVGQGLIFLVLGLILSKKFKTGMMSKLSTAFVPMGIFAMIFGFLYGEIFLMEGIIHPILLSPIYQIGKLFKIVLGIAVLEMCIGLVIGAINAVREGHVLGPLGQHGAGSILFLVGIYFGALYLVEVGDFKAIISHWTFVMIIAGLLLSGIEPLLTALKHDELGAEVLGEVVAAFMMVFIEILANFFSFLRIGAFALAHSCLAVAAHALMNALGPIGIVLMNMIAMTFEFVSSSVQSLRLLYYEFMSKFFKGTGTQLRPFRLKEES